VSTPAPQAHWQNVYQTKRERDVSWFQESPAISLDLIRATGIGNDATIVDIGGGASRLVDALIAEGFKSVTVLDLSEKALATSRTRLGALGAHVSWVVADVTKWQPVVTTPRRSARCSVHLSSLSRAGATIIKRRPEPFSDSSSAALCAKRLSDATEVRSCSAYPAVDDPARACGLGRALEGGETRAQPAASFFLASLGVRIVVDLDRLKARDWRRDRHRVTSWPPNAVS
jgi:Methyltransferase domain